MMSRVMLNLQEKAEHMRTPNATYGSIESSAFGFPSHVSTTVQFADTSTTSSVLSSSGSSAGGAAGSRTLLSSHGKMEPIDEVMELQELGLISRDLLHPTVSGLV